MYGIRKSYVSTEVFTHIVKARRYSNILADTAYAYFVTAQTLSAPPRFVLLLIILASEQLVMNWRGYASHSSVYCIHRSCS